MEMERIDENTIRVTLGNDDLSARGITVLDLLGNRQQIERFFYSILDEVDTDHTFAENNQVTFQVLPSKNGLELLISKNLFDGSEMDHDSDSQDDPKSANDSIDAALRRQLQGTDGQSSDEDDDDQFDADDLSDDSQVKITVLKLNEFEDMVSLADTLQLEGAVSDLYHYQNAYYLQLTFYLDQIPMEIVKDQLAVASEFTQITTVTPEVLAEYGQRIMTKSALELTHYYFD